MIGFSAASGMFRAARVGPSTSTLFCTERPLNTTLIYTRKLPSRVLKYLVKSNQVVIVDTYLKYLIERSKN